MSGTTEEATVPDIVFRGTDGNECEAFIVAIQNFAFFVKGRDEDHHWMLRFARTCLRGKALRWYATLDPSVQKDWYLFVKALFDQYPLAEEAGAAEIATPVWSATTFSPAPSTVALPPNPDADRKGTGQKFTALTPRHYDASSTGQQIGLLRIVNEQEANIPQYIWWDESAYTGYPFHLAMTTTNRHEALVVSFLPSPSSVPHTIGCLSSRGVKTLAFLWNSSVSTGEAEYYTIYNYSRGDPGITPSMNKYGYITKVWNLLADGTLQASLSGFSRKSGYEAFEEIKFTTTEVHVDTSGDNICFVKPGTLFEQDKPKGNPVHPFVRARIVFEPL